MFAPTGDLAASQVALSQPFAQSNRSRGTEILYSDTRVIPAWIVLCSAITLLLHIFIVSTPIQALITRFRRNTLEESATLTPDSGSLSQPENRRAQFKQHVARLGGETIFAYMVVRLAGCLTLLSLSVASFVSVKVEKNTSDADAPGWGNSTAVLSFDELLHAVMRATFVYVSLLALVSVAARRRWSAVVTRHLNVVLLVLLCVYVYRDIYPLATFTKTAQDISEGWILWAKIIVLTLTAGLLPLTIPRQYKAFDPKNPYPNPNPEQTASILSLMVYRFLDPVIFLANRVPHLAFEQLPPLADDDATENLKARSFQHLDAFSGGKDRHIFFSIIWIFRRDWVLSIVMLVFYVISSFAGPIAIYNLLQFLETGGDGANMKLWFWVLALFVGPLIGNICNQRYSYLVTRTIVRVEAIVTQLVFEHALRIRVKAETSDVVTGTQPAATKPSSSGKNLTGKINSLVTTDLANVVQANDFLYLLVYIPLQIVLSISFLYVVLGWSAFVGLAAILLLFPVPGFVAKQSQKIQRQRLKETDARVQSVTETMNVLRMIKMFGWEQKMGDKIGAKREEELAWIRKRQWLDMVNVSLHFVIPVVVMITTFAAYNDTDFYDSTAVMKEELNASKVFSSMTVFEGLRTQIYLMLRSITSAVTGKISLDRITDFLRKTELLDDFSENGSSKSLSTLPRVNSEDVGFRHATFAWSSDSDGSSTPSNGLFSLKIEEELMFQRGVINLVVGPTGSGKTSLLMALLGEMHFISNGRDAWYNLPRERGVAYVAQESWVQNETIKENIIFGSTIDETRYKKVLQQCGLEHDISLFAAGDQTEVGEKGLTLSGGQKARITLARAVYSQAEIILMDDVLAALDVHTAKWIIEKCFKGDLIKGRTVILVTHNVAMTRPIADFVVSMNNGRVISTGSISEVVAKDHLLEVEIKEEQEALDKAEEEVDSQLSPDEPKPKGTLIVSEEIAQGDIGWPAANIYLASMGGDHPYLFFMAFLGGLILNHIANTLQTWFLGYWASQYENHPASEVRALYYLGIYGCILVLGVILYYGSYVVYVYGILRASRTIHRKLIKSVLGTTVRWLDTTPTSRVIARCTQDIGAVDGPIALWLQIFVDMSTAMFMKLSAVVIVTPIFILPGILLFLAGAWVGRLYLKANLSVKREMSNAKAPVLGHFGAAIAGITSIRAYGAQKTFIKQSLQRISCYTRAARTFQLVNRWIGIRIDAMGALFTASLAAYLVYFQNNIAGTTGFSLNMAVGFSSLIMSWVRILNVLEIQAHSLERLESYIEIEQEPKATPQGVPPAYWPASGTLTVESLSARYSPDGPKVLHDISFTIKSGERIGVVGRTGSGKSSLTLSLLRCIYTDGAVYYDGIPTASLNLDALRNNITIIPQMPELLSGSLRQNLDPFDQYEDNTLNDALRAAGLFSLQGESDEGRITLDSAISSGGGNLSVGQRQILALARAIVRRSKLLVLDEDHKTDAVIQESLRHSLGSDVTVMIVAHRLQTVMDADKIMVLEAGRIVEFDRPAELLKIRQGKLRSLVDESIDKEILYSMIKGNQ